MTIEKFMESNEILEILKSNIERINSALNDIDRASSYSRSSATTSYCGYAESSLMDVKQKLELIISQLSMDGNKKANDEQEREM